MKKERGEKGAGKNRSRATREEEKTNPLRLAKGRDRESGSHREVKFSKRKETRGPCCAELREKNSKLLVHVGRKRPRQYLRGRTKVCQRKP